MYCGQCGKKVMDNMLFCPFCGSPIVIPDQPDAPPVSPDAPGAPDAGQIQEVRAHAEPERPESSGAGAPERPASLFGDASEPSDAPEALDAPEPVDIPEAFVPLRFEYDAESAPEAPRAAAVEIIPAEEARAERDGRGPSRRPAPQALRRPESARRRAAQTFIPVKEIAPDDMFMDGGDDLDDYDLDDAPARGHYDMEFEFEEPERGGFLQRHIRGLVALLLLALMGVIFAVWAFSPKGQLVLAKANLAWTAQPYADLGYEAYHQDSDLLAARYYEKAAARDPGNYEYAHSAMVAYYEAEEIESAAAMLKKCIEMNPDSAEPYQEMLILYPDAQTRPWEIQELIRQGYARTGNPTLNLDGA